MVSSNKAGLDLREILPLSRYILHTWSNDQVYGTANESNGIIISEGLPKLVIVIYQPKG